MKKLVSLAVLALFSASPVFAQERREVSKGQYCNEVKRLDDAIDSLKRLEGSAPVSTLRQRLDTIKRDLATVVEHGEALSSEAHNELNRARAELLSAIQSLPNEVSVKEAREMINPQIKDVKRAQKKLEESTACD